VDKSFMDVLRNPSRRGQRPGCLNAGPAELECRPAALGVLGTATQRLGIEVGVIAPGFGG
jgi:hypothetical protein